MLNDLLAGYIDAIESNPELLRSPKEAERMRRIQAIFEHKPFNNDAAVRSLLAEIRDMNVRITQNIPYLQHNIQKLNELIDRTAKDKPFDQTDYINANEQNFAEGPKAALKQYGGLCQCICNIIVLLGHQDPKVQNVLKKNGEFDNKEVLEMVNELSINAHALNLMNFIEIFLAVFFQIPPLSPLHASENKALLEVYNGLPQVNVDRFRNAFDKLEFDHYYQLTSAHSEKHGPFSMFSDQGHATLIFKTKDNSGKTIYNYFDPNTGFKESHDVKDLAELINKSVMFQNLKPNLELHLGITDIEKLLKRSELAQRYKDQSANAGVII